MCDDPACRRRREAMEAELDRLRSTAEEYIAFRASVPHAVRQVADRHKNETDRDQEVPA
ncbi:hypothetical protein [Halorarius halobius]|uniref:hypothetical protein n=1 Tax=Halorarius halobius TaxID=2962671 RepID=UPI0020CF6934|nr:hypothetical protein [Halorarius halobius]